MPARTPFSSLILAATLLTAVSSIAHAQTAPANPQRIATLIKQLDDPDAKGSKSIQTRQAMDELKTIGTPAIKPLLDSAFSHETGWSYVKNTLIEMGPAVLPPLLERWNAAESEKPRLAVLDVRQALDPPGARAYIRGLLQHKDAAIRFRAMNLLDVYPDPEAKPALLAAFQKEIPAYRWSCLWALTKIGGDDVVAALLPLLEKDSWAATNAPTPLDDAPYWENDGRANIAGALRRLKAEKAAPALLALLREKGEGQSYMGSVLIPALADLNYKPAAAEFHAICAEAKARATRPADTQPRKPLVQPQDFPREARTAAYALLQLGDHSVIPDLINDYRKSLPHTDDNKLGFRDFRRQIAEKLSQYATRDEIPVLALFLDDADTGVQMTAIQALSRLTSTPVDKSLGDRRNIEIWKDWWKSHAKDFPPPPK